MGHDFGARWTRLQGACWKKVQFSVKAIGRTKICTLKGGSRWMEVAGCPGLTVLRSDFEKTAVFRGISVSQTPTLFSILFDESLTLSQTSPGFYVSAAQISWKHCGKRRNCSLRAISPFPHSVFYPFEELSAIYLKFKIVVCNFFQFRRV